MRVFAVSGKYGAINDLNNFIRFLKPIKKIKDILAQAFRTGQILIALLRKSEFLILFDILFCLNWMKVLPKNYQDTK
jgi:hypothetical protein